MQLTIRAKMLAGYAAVMLLTAIIGSMGIFGMERMNDMMTSMYADSLLPLRNLEDANVSLQKMNGAVVEALGTKDRAELATAEKMITDDESAMLKSIQSYSKSNLGTEQRTLLSKLDSDWKAYKKDRDSGLQLHHDGGDQAAVVASMASAREKLATVEQTLDKLTEGEARLAQEVDLASKDLSGKAGLGTLILLGIALIGGLWVALRLSTAITGRLKSMAGTVAAVAEGDTNQKVAVEGHDEFGQMAEALDGVLEYVKEMAATAEAISEGDLTVKVTPRADSDSLGIAFQKMALNLRELCGGIAKSAGTASEAGQQLSGSTEQLESAAQQISAAIQQIAAGNQEDASQAQETSSSMQELTSAIEQIAKGSKDQADSIQEATGSVDHLNRSISEVASASTKVSSATLHVHQAAISGAESVEKSMQGMMAIETSTKAVALRIQELNRYSKQIGSIVEAIDDIAGQTNLLALNAAIEAARAGEHGRGFAVVATEVSKLAARAEASTKEIADLIAQVQKEAQDAVSDMEQSTREVEAGSHLAEEADSALKSILESSEATSSQMREITSNVQEMKEASEEVVGVMTSISAVVEEFTAATQQMMASSRHVGEAVDRVAAVSEETSAATQEVGASTEEMTRQISQFAAEARGLSETADSLRAIGARFKIDDNSNEVVLRRREGDWNKRQQLRLVPRTLAQAAPSRGDQRHE